MGSIPIGAGIRVWTPVPAKRDVENHARSPAHVRLGTRARTGARNWARPIALTSERPCGPHCLDQGLLRARAFDTRHPVLGTARPPCVSQCAPVTNRQRSCFEFHSNRRLFQSANVSLEWTAAGSMPNQPLETADVLHRVMGLGQQLGLVEHGSLLDKLSTGNSSYSRVLLLFY